MLNLTFLFQLLIQWSGHITRFLAVSIILVMYRYQIYIYAKSAVSIASSVVYFNT